MLGPDAAVSSWLVMTVARLWPAPKVSYTRARRVGAGQSRRWCTLSERARIKQAKFTI